MCEDYVRSEYVGRQTDRPILDRISQPTRNMRHLPHAGADASLFSRSDFAIGARFDFFFLRLTKKHVQFFSRSDLSSSLHVVQFFSAVHVVTVEHGRTSRGLRHTRTTSDTRHIFKEELIRQNCTQLRRVTAHPHVAYPTDTASFTA